MGNYIDKFMAVIGKTEVAGLKDEKADLDSIIEERKGEVVVHNIVRKDQWSTCYP